VASHDGRNGSVTIHQDVDLYGTLLSASAIAELALGSGRHARVQVVRGDVRVNGTQLAAGDGAALSDERAVRVQADAESELLLFDLA
jgi:hypothetical protein